VMIGGNTPELPGYTYTWTSNAAANAGIDCPSCPRTLVRPNVNASYTFNYVLTVTAPWGQQCRDTVRVTVWYKQVNTFVTLPASYTVDCSNPGATTLLPTITTANPPIVNHDWKSLTYPSVNNLASTTIASPAFANCNNGSNPATFFITATDNFGCQASAKTTVSYVNGGPTGGGGNPNRVAPGGFTKALPDKGAGQQAVAISPNPNKGQFTIQGLHGKPIARVVISNSDGRRVKVLERVNAMQVQVHLPMADGIYLAAVWLAGMRKPVVQKIVIANR
jgi:hypothetical protein